jgi:hypothetical protein
MRTEGGAMRMTDVEAAPCYYCHAAVTHPCRTRTGYMLTEAHQMRRDFAHVVRNVLGKKAANTNDERGVA